MTKLRISPDLLLPEDVVTSTTVVYGGKGMGKTNLGSVIVEELTKARLRWCFLDPMGVAWGLRHSADGKGPGVECVILGGAHGDIPIEPTGGAIVADLVVDENVNTIIDFSRKANGEMWSLGEKVRFVTEYALRLFRRQGELLPGNRRREPLMQILDEAARYIPQVIPSGAIDLAKCVGAWEQACEEGRNIGLGVCFLTQRSARMNKSVSELADVMFAFRTVGPRSLEAVMDWLGEHVAKDRVRTLAAQVRELNVGQALVVSPGWLKVEKIATIRPRETFDSSATPKPGQQAKRVTGDAAKPDLAKYHERMAATIEKVKADDPKELRRRIAELERSKNLTAVSAANGKPGTNQKAIDRAVAAAARQSAATIKTLRDALGAAMNFIIQITTRNFDDAGIDKVELERAVQSAMAKATELVDRKLSARAKDIDELRKAASRIGDKLKRVLEADGEDVVISVDVTRNEPFTVDAPRPAAARSAAPRKSVAHRTDSDLPAGAQKLLDAAARLASVNIDAPTRTQVAALAPMSPTSSATERYFANCIELAYFERGDVGCVRLTDAGRSVATPVDAPPTLDDYIAEWQRLLGAGAERKLYDAMIARAKTTSIARAELAELAEISSTSSATERGFAWLIGLDLLQKAGTGEVKPGPTMFPEGLV